MRGLIGILVVFGIVFGGPIEEFSRSLKKIPLSPECGEWRKVRFSSPLKEYPSEKSLSLEQLKPGEKVCVLRRKGRWVKVYTENNLPGYLRASALKNAPHQEGEGFKRFLRIR